MTKVLYFARMRQLAGRSSDDIEIPPEVTTVRGLIAHLAASDGGLAAAFADERIIRAAIDRAHVQLDAPIAGAGEIAFFPPVTGG
jgi:sulfur-carrier protein